MSLVGFKARNHPQQATQANVDDRAITPEDFAPLHARFNFTIDAAASVENARLPRFWTIEDNGLTQPWLGRIWCNPPYSDINTWVEKAWTEHYRGMCQTIVMLLPANRTEQGWWQRNVEPYRDNTRKFRVEFLPGRMRFLRNGATDIKPNERPPFGCCLLIWQQP